MAPTRFGPLATSVLALVASVHSLPSGLARRQAEAYTFSGCYIDNSDGHRALPAASYDDDHMTIASCAAFCAKYKYFGVEYARECFCDNTISSAATTVDPSQCSFPCAGDATATCGAGDRLSVYENTAPSTGPAPAQLDGIPYAGCFHEAPGRVLPSKGISAPDMTTAKCAENCVGYLYFGTEYGSECYCGNELPTHAATESDCAMTCSGDSSELCGGGDRLNVYGPASLTPPTFEPVGDYIYQGCYTDGSTERALDGSTLFDDHMTLEMCAAACSSYAWFGVEFGKECYCGTALQSSSVEKPQSDCTMPCGGNHGQTCGSMSRLSVYHNPALGGTGGSSPASVGEFTYKSCWTDDVYDRSLKGSSYASDDMTLESCAAFCSEFTYFGVEFSHECYCDNAVLGAAADESECSELCKGDSSAWCGGPGRLNLYEKLPEEPSSDGCPGSAPPSAVLVNGAFECGTLEPWTIGNLFGGAASIEADTLRDPPSNALKVESSFYFEYAESNINIYQTLNTVPGQTYQLSFEVHKAGGSGNAWSVSVGSNPPFASGTTEQGGIDWTTFTTTFTAAGEDRISLQFNSIIWAYANFYFDNFVITKVVPLPYM